MAVGDAGLIGLTTNGDSEWEPAFPSQTTQVVNSIACPDASNCYATAGDEVLTTHDGGTTWAGHLTSGPDQLDSISCPTTTTCFASGWPGDIYATTDGGNTWSAQSNPVSGADETLLGVSCANSTNCYAVGTQGLAISTSDGANWHLESSGTSKTLTGVACPTVGVCVAVGVSGTIVIRGAAGWQPRPSGTTNDLFAVTCMNWNSCRAVGVKGTVLASGSGGSSWTAQHSGVSDNLLGVDCTPLGLCIAVGSGSSFIQSVDGRTWTTQPSPTSNILLGAEIAPSGQAWLVGVGGSILVNPGMFGCTGTPLSTSYFSWFDRATPGMVADNIHILNTGTSTSSGCVTLSGYPGVPFSVAPGQETHVTLPAGYIGGPLLVTVNSGPPVLASQRVQYYNSFNEVWAMSASQAATTSYLSWFDRASPGMVGDNIHVLNPGGTTANVTVSMPGAAALPLTLAPGTEGHVSFGAGHIGGPVTITSDQPVLASQRVQYYQTFNEVVARSAAQASTTSYFNWFDKATPGMVGDNIHVVNPGATPANVTVSIPGAKPMHIQVPAGGEQYATFAAGNIGGPVTVSADQPVLASQRVQYYKSFNETASESASEAPTTGHLMWFDRATPGMLADNIHLLNTSASTATGTITLPGATSVSFSLAPGQEEHFSFPAGHIGGPLIITTSVPVLGAQRVQYYQTFNEVPAT